MAGEVMGFGELMVESGLNGLEVPWSDSKLAIINSGYLNFSDEPNPNVINYPLPNHAELKVNAITKEQSQKIKTNVKEVKTPMKVIYEVLVKTRFFKLGKEEQDKKEMSGHICEYHTIAMG